jgi:hypothetical protein
MTVTTETGLEQKSVSVWQLLASIIDRPVAAFKGAEARNGWGVWAFPLSLLLLAFTITTIIQIPYVAEMAREQTERQLAMLPPEQAEAAQASMGFTMSVPFLLATGLGFGAASIVVSLLAQAVFFYFGTLMMGSNDTSFGSIFKMSAWSRIPMAIGLLVQGAFVAITKNFIQYPGLAFLVTTGDLLEDARNPLVPLLSSLDLFWLWHLLLIGLGLGVIGRLSRTSALLLVILYGALSLGLKVLPSLIFGAGGFQPGA